MLLENVDWQIISKCNRTCKYCFGPKHSASLSLEETYKTIDLLMSLGVKQIGLTGGEPLLHPNIIDIIDYIHSQGINIYLSTNCDFYYKYKDVIKEKITIIGIPLDGSTQEIHDHHRGNNSYHNVINVMNDILESKSNIMLKVGTVVTKYNYHDLQNIEKLLFKYNEKIIFWKIYELILYERNKKEATEFLTDKIPVESDFSSYVDKAKIIIDTRELRNNSYFFLKPNADIFIPHTIHKISKEFTIGNLLKNDTKDCLERFQKLYNCKGYHAEYRYMKNERGSINDNQK